MKIELDGLEGPGVEHTSTDINKMILPVTRGIPKEVVADYISQPFDVITPEEKVKKRPDGFDYVEGSWMDKSFKDTSPLYSNRLVHRSEKDGWISVYVEVTDRITGNTELGGASARVMVRQGVENPTGRDILDKGNNEASALTKAIKNAQSRFGHAADIYGRRESVPTDDEKSRYTEMLTEIKTINSSRGSIFAEQWTQLGTDYSLYLDQWQVYINRHHKKSSVVESNKEINV